MKQQWKRKLAGRRRASRTAAQSLGWFSIGLGIAEILAPRMVARALGVQGGADVVRAYGLREIATGIGILTAKDPTPWVWGRVAGDALDLASLGGALAQSGQKACVVGAIGAVAGGVAGSALTGGSTAGTVGGAVVGGVVGHEVAKR